MNLYDNINIIDETIILVPQVLNKVVLVLLLTIINSVTYIANGTMI